MTLFCMLALECPSLMPEQDLMPLTPEERIVHALPLGELVDTLVGRGWGTN